MPSFGGDVIFGQSVSMTTVNLPRRVQVNAYFGVNGLEELDGGFAGRITEARGVLIGIDAATLASVIETFRSYEDGIARTLVDTKGVSWTNVKLESFAPQGRVLGDPWYGYLQPYIARFRHLT